MDILITVCICFSLWFIGNFFGSIDKLYTALMICMTYLGIKNLREIRTLREEIRGTRIQEGNKTDEKRSKDNEKEN